MQKCCSFVSGRDGRFGGDGESDEARLDRSQRPAVGLRPDQLAGGARLPQRDGRSCQLRLGNSVLAPYFKIFGHYRHSCLSGTHNEPGKVATIVMGMGSNRELAL